MKWDGLKKIEYPMLVGNAYGILVGTDSFIEFLIDHKLTCFTYDLADTAANTRGGQGIAGWADFTLDISIERDASGNAEDMSVLLFYTPHQDDGTHLTPTTLQLVKDAVIPVLTSDPATNAVVTFSLLSHDNSAGHVGTFILVFQDEDGSQSSIGSPYPSCSQGNTAAGVGGVG